MRNARNWRKLLAGCLLSLLLPTVYYKFNGNRWRTPNDVMMHRDVVDLDAVDPDPNELDPALEAAPVEISTFEGFNNETGTDSFIVPNIVHYIRFNKATFSFVDYVCIRSAYVNHRPQRIFFHTNENEFSGEYWDKMKSEPDFYARIRIRKTEVPSEIFGQKLSSGWQLYHGSDVARIRLMMKYGGIYLDNDIYVVSSLDKYRRFEIVMGWDQDQFLGNQVIIANKNARFLPLYLDTYKEYHSDLWYYNAGERPTVEVLYKRPELLHRVKLKFGVHMLVPKLYLTQWPEWRQQDTIHLLINHRSYLDPHFKEYPAFDNVNIANYSYTFGDMAREMLT